PQHVEVLSGRRRIRDGEVALRNELQKAFEARARMFGALALVAVRHQQDETGVLPPLRAVSHDELIDDRLRDVGEVAELRLPQYELVRDRRAEPVLEAHHCGLGELAIINL